MSEFALEMREISKTYGKFRANNKINFRVRKGSIHALAGENGAGKSTLMKILFGMVGADSEDNNNCGIFIHGSKVNFKNPQDAIGHGVGMVQQHFALVDALPALDNVILGNEPNRYGFISRSEIAGELDNIAQFLKVPWTAATGDLPVSFKQRLEIIKLLFRKAEILILDEPTAALAPKEVKSFFTFLKELKTQGKTMIIITHKLDEVFEISDEVTVLRQGSVVGTYKTADLNKDKLIQAMIGRQLNVSQNLSHPQSQILLEISKISTSPSKVDVTDSALDSISLSLKYGEVLGVAGVAGQGQSNFVKALFGLIPATGEVTFNGKPISLKTWELRNKYNWGLISEDRHHQGLWMDGNIAENLVLGKIGGEPVFSGLDFKGLDESFSDLLTNYQIKCEGLHSSVKSLSGGNQQKVVVAREVGLKKPQFLLAHEPTRGVDIGAIENIHYHLVSLISKGGSIILISSDLEELCKLSNRIVVFSKGKIAGEFVGPHYRVEEIGAAMVGDLN